MIGFLRFLGVANAAVWLGATVFFTLAVRPAFSSAEMLYWFGGNQLGEMARAYSGGAAQVIIERYYVLQYCCGIFALIHLGAERLYLGRPVSRATSTMLVALIALSLIGGFALQPRLKQLHLTRYGARSTAEEKDAAARSFRLWHGLSTSLHIITLGGIAVYLWRINLNSNPDRFISVTKFRG